MDASPLLATTPSHFDIARRVIGDTTRTLDRAGAAEPHRGIARERLEQRLRGSPNAFGIAERVVVVIVVVFPISIANSWLIVDVGGHAG